MCSSYDAGMTVRTGDDGSERTEDSVVSPLIGLWEPTDNAEDLVMLAARIWSVLNQRPVSREVIIDMAEYKRLVLTDEQVDAMVDAVNKCEAGEQPVNPQS